MKAAILDSPNSVPVYGDFAEPAAGPDTEVVDLVAAGIHHVTRSVAAGRHYGSAGVYPLIPGLNAVARTAGGHLVFTSSAPPPYGTFAERIASPRPTRCGSRCRTEPRQRPSPRASTRAWPPGCRCRPGWPRPGSSPRCSSSA